MTGRWPVSPMPTRRCRDTCQHRISLDSRLRCRPGASLRDSVAIGSRRRHRRLGEPGRQLGGELTSAIRERNVLAFSARIRSPVTFAKPVRPAGPGYLDLVACRRRLHSDLASRAAAPPDIRPHAAVAAEQLDGLHRDIGGGLRNTLDRRGPPCQLFAGFEPFGWPEPRCSVR